MRDGENGHVSCADDVDAMMQVLERLVEQTNMRTQCGLHGLCSQEIISGWGISQTVGGIVEAAVSISENKHLRLGERL